MLAGPYSSISLRPIALLRFVLPVLTLVGGAIIHPAIADEGSGDFTNDCAVNLDDFSEFEECLNGPGGGLPESECWRGDCDDDGDVDLQDFGAFQAAFGSAFDDATGACCLPDDTCPQLTCSACTAAGGLFVAPGAATCDIVVCCQSDIRTDSDNDGDIDDDDEVVESFPPGVIFVVNSDDDNDNGIPDMDENPVIGEDDLAEIQLSSTCDPIDPGSAWWSLSWPVADPPLLQIWENFDKTSGPIGSPIENDVPYPWPPPATLWVEAMETFELDLTFTISVDDTRAKKKDKVKTTVSCTPGRKYTQVYKEEESATGCSATIRTRTTVLCGEPSTKSRASSNAWVGVTKFVGPTPEKWGQMGYARDRIGVSTTVLVRRYAETRWGSGPFDFEIFFQDGIPSGTHEYKCYLMSPLFGIWKYEYDGTSFHTTDNFPGWRNVTGTCYHWSTEIANKEDQMVGTTAAKCNFTECQYSASWGAFQNANITAIDLYTDDASAWGIERVSATAFNVWDKNP